MLAWLNQPVDAVRIAVFRGVFGLAVVAWALSYLIRGDVAYYYIVPPFHFTYDGFGFVRPPTGHGMYAVFGVLAASGLLLAAGLFYRASAAVVVSSYTYIFLIDRTPYNNHHYLICLLGGIFCVIHAGGEFSVDAAVGRTARVAFVPRWQEALLQFQILVVYFFGGVAKLRPDWLAGLPLGHWLQERGGYPIIGPVLSQPWSGQLLSVAGLVFDLSIAPLLCWRRSRRLALAAAAAFHLSNQAIFHIGVFHILMLGTLLLFVEPATLRRALRRGSADNNSAVRPVLGKPGRVLLAAYVLVQVLVPLRQFLYPGDMAWTEEGRSWAWQIKARDKRSMGVFHVLDPASGPSFDINTRDDLTAEQAKEMFRRPDMMWQYAQFQREKLTARGVLEPVITVTACASLNGRPFSLLVDPGVNLAAAAYSPWWHTEWIMPLPEGNPPRTWPRAPPPQGPCGLLANADEESDPGGSP